ncbi:hypothetical protein ABMA27_012773 [Loxostege sticticalis]|uniref:Peptidase S1 domain-containing protein n=1 Tax=Loxostege sticticalis TaxID=481309 RepID=A0ABR3GZS6_LOXSC
MRKLLPILVIVCSTVQTTWAQTSLSPCTLQNGQLGVCIETEQCNPDTNTVYDDGSGIINFRSGTDPIVCPSSQVCCLYPGTAAATLSAALVRGSPATDISETCGYQKRQTVPGYVKTKTNEADPGEFPWAVNLMIKIKDANYQYAGTGSLIHDRVVLTAARALFDKDTSNLAAAFGEHDINKRVLPKKMVRVREIVMHSNFDSSDGKYNFALAFLSSSAMKSLPHVGTVCLPPASYVATAGANCVFAGWGADGAGNYQDQLTKTEVPMVSHSACEERLRQNPKLGPGFQLHSSFTCAGGEMGKDICGGAAGSPLVCPIEGQQSRFVQTGIVSWIGTCGKDGAPTAFADVAAARPWIDQQMDDRQYSTASYTY